MQCSQGLWDLENIQVMERGEGPDSMWTMYLNSQGVQGAHYLSLLIFNGSDNTYHHFLGNRRVFYQCATSGEDLSL